MIHRLTQKTSHELNPCGLLKLSLHFQRSISENSLVAMDFSGQKSRVIENPSEALSVAVEEGLSWRVSYSLKKQNKTKQMHNKTWITLEINTNY